MCRPLAASGGFFLYREDEEALKIITFLKDKPWGKTTYGQIMIKDLKALEKEGATHSDVREIIEMLK